MSTQQHDSELLSAYVLGALDEQEAREVEGHIASCEECRKEVAELREMELALGEIPPEAFLEGPPEGGDLLLQRTLRQVRTERTASQRRRSFTVGVAVAASATVVFLGGYLVADAGSSDAQAVRPPVSTAATVPGTAPTGVLLGSATDPATQARMTVRVTPAADWVRVNAAVTGIPAGERCRLVVVSKDGHREIAGSWVVGRTDTGAGKGADLDGSAAIKAGEVTSVSVESESRAGTRSCRECLSSERHTTAARQQCRRAAALAGEEGQLLSTPCQVSDGAVPPGANRLPCRADGEPDVVDALAVEGAGRGVAGVVVQRPLAVRDLGGAVRALRVPHQRAVQPVPRCRRCPWW